MTNSPLLARLLPRALLFVGGSATLSFLAGCAPPHSRFPDKLAGCRMYMMKPMGADLLVVSLASCVIEDEVDVPEYGTVTRYAVLRAYAKDDGTGNHVFERPAMIQFDAELEKLPERIRTKVARAGGYSSRVPVSVLLPLPGETAVEGEAFELLPPRETLPEPRGSEQSARQAVPAGSRTAGVSWCKTTPKTFHIGVPVGGESQAEQTGPRVFAADCKPIVVRASIHASDGSSPSNQKVVAMRVGDDGQVALTFTAEGIQGPQATLEADGTFSLSIETGSQDLDTAYVFGVIAPPLRMLQRGGKPFVVHLRDGPVLDLGTFEIPDGFPAAASPPPPAGGEPAKD